jgi:di/tricarboxylate transporter
MSNWILVGPVVGVVLITVALVIGYVVVPPMIVQRVTEVRKKVLNGCLVSRVDK